MRFFADIQHRKKKNRKWECENEGHKKIGKVPGLSVIFFSCNDFIVLLL